MILSPCDGLSYWSQQAYRLGVKIAADAVPSYAMTGLLYLSERAGKPWGLLSVPNALVRGTFDALHEPGIELPLIDGKLDAHISVFRPEELELLGGADAIKNDRGKPFRYSIGRLVSLTPDTPSEHKKIFCLRIHSPELQELRRSHGLSSLPKSGQYDFHVTVATIKAGTTARNEKSKDVTPA